MNADGLERRAFPTSRLATLDLGRYAKDRHAMYGLLEVDVTEARQAARGLRRAGQGVSLTAWLIKAIANSVARHREVQAVASGKRRVVVFDSVDVALPVERTVEGGRAPLPVLIRRADSRSVHEIHGEIEAALRQEVSDESQYILGEHGFSRLAMRLYYMLPQPMRVLAWKLLFANPARARKLSGTVTVTTVGGSGRTVGWILPTRTMHNLHFSLGSISRKPKALGERIVVRDVMNLTVYFNHDVLDGVPARRFMEDLVSHIEKGRLE